MVLDTHSVDLDRYDLAELAVLRTDNGLELLPAVWDSLPNPAEFLRELRRKAGIPPADRWLDLRVWRYTVDSFAA